MKIKKEYLLEQELLEMIKWCKQVLYQIQYALDVRKNNLTEVEKQLLLKELQEIIM